ncbi:unnamed protein product [Acanthoscelides obtectus]|uniref:Uncharacterized protein n=1 Tax=Acanthoscelides obtectus TaxID=200917 RepID=A0A9P0JSX5_ACAOB|nr:unnamed protein product [Acanthoscelides obtectus]CAK1633994.1 hypothetical protein AOBTE_LOCUS8525 [Acanthoscelides obtectus]
MYNGNCVKYGNNIPLSELEIFVNRYVCLYASSVTFNFHLPRKNGAGLQRSSNVCGNFPIAWVRSMENTYK